MERKSRRQSEQPRAADRAREKIRERSLAHALLFAPSMSRLRALFAVLAALALWSSGARADDVVPAPTPLPSPLSMDEALRLFRTRGLDLLIADANTRVAEGQVIASGAMPNPVASGSVGNAITYANTAYSQSNCLQNGTQCTPWIYNIGLTDSAAIEDTLSGKRGLRLKVARNALAAAKLSRADAERQIAFQVKTAYLGVAQAELALRFAKEVAATNVTTLKKNQDRLANGAINEGDLQRIETQKLESDQALDTAVMNLREARVALAFLLGVRGEVSDFEVDAGVLDYSVPSSLRDATDVGLMRTAFERRPDLASLGYQVASSEAAIDLVKRQRFPDITLGVNYAWGGFGGISTNGPVGPQTLTFGVSMPIPVLYQLQGETRQAEANYDANKLAHAKAAAQIVSDVATARAGYLGAKRLVERMEGPRRDGGGLLESAKGAFEAVAIQYEKGTATLTDYLDALRTYIATKAEYFGDLTNYWTAVFQLEEAVGTDLGR